MRGGGYRGRGVSGLENVLIKISVPQRLLETRKYLLFPFDTVNFVWKTDEGETESIVLLIFVLWWWLSRR